MLRLFVIGSLVAVAAFRFTVIQVATAKPSGMGKFGPEGVPAAARIFAAAPVCIATNSVLVCVLIEIPVIGAFDRLAVHIGIAPTTAIRIHYRFRRATARSILLCVFRIVVQRIRCNQAWHSTFTSHKNTAILRADFSSTRPARKTGRTDKDVCFLLYD